MSSDKSTESKPAPTKPETAPSDGFFANREEHTVAGALIGAVRDAFGAPETAEARNQRAAINDEYAHLAADVVSCIPQVRLLAAAGIRGGLLFDPNGGWMENTVSLGVNAVGGSAMNKVMKWCSPEGTLGQAMAKSTDTPFLKEATGHWLSGFSFGAARGTFDTRSWFDDQGKLSAEAGIRNIAFSTTYSALLNVPAGMLASRVAARIGTGAAESVFPRIITGTTAGGAAGATFGFIDGAIHSHSLSGAFAGLGEGFAVGAISGGGISAIPPGRFSPISRTVYERPAPPAEPETVTTAAATSTDATPITPTDAAPVTRPRPAPPLENQRLPNSPLIGDGTFDAAKVQGLMAEHSDALTFKSRSLSVWDLDHSLPEPTKVDYRRLRLKPDAPTQFATEAEFYKALHTETTPALQYDLGTRKLTITQEYADALNSVRDLRRDQSEAVFDHALGIRALPEDVAKVLLRQPDNSRIGDITMVAEPSLSDLRKQMVAETRPEDLKGFSTTASIDTKTGELTLFRPNIYRIEDTLNHEQVHRTQEGIKQNDEEERNFFARHITEQEATIDTYAIARKIDEKTEATPYGYTQDVESEAELESRVFLNRSLQTFFEGAERAPVRMASIARRLARTINNAEPENRSMDAQEMLARANYIERNVTPKVVDSLVNAIESGEHPDAGPLLAKLVSEPNARTTAILEKELTHGEKRMRLAAAGLARMDWRANLPKILEASDNTLRPGEWSLYFDSVIDAQPSRSEQHALGLAIAKSSFELARLGRSRFENADWINSPEALELLPKVPGNDRPTPIARLRNALNEPDIQWNEEGTNHDEIQKQTETKELAAEMMRFYGDKTDIPALQSIVKEQQPTGAYDHGITHRGKKALKSMAVLHSPDPHEQLNFLLKQAAPDSDIRETALHVLSHNYAKYQGDWTGLPESEAYSSIFSMLTNYHMTTDVLARGLKSLPTTAARQQWFDDVVPRIENQDYIGSDRIDIALTRLADGIIDIPGLRERAQELRSRIPVPDDSKPEWVSTFSY